MKLKSPNTVGTDLNKKQNANKSLVLYCAARNKPT